MQLYASPWVGSGTEEDPFHAPTDQDRTSIDFRGDATAGDGWCLLAVPELDADVVKAGGVYLGDSLDDPAAGELLMRTFGLTFKGRGRPAVRDAVLDLFVEHATRPGDKSRFNRLVPVKVPTGRRLEAWIGGERLFALAIPSGGATQAESFDGGSGSLNGSGVDLVWTVSNGQITMVSNGARPNIAGSTRNLAYTTTNMDSSDHYGESVIDSTSTSTSARWGACVRHSTSDLTCYFGWLQGNGASSISKYVAGTATLDLATSTGTKANGDTIRVSANGSTITIYKNGASQTSVTDTDISGNVRAGCFVYSNTGTTSDGRIASWAGADLVVDAGVGPRRNTPVRQLWTPRNVGAIGRGV